MCAGDRATVLPTGRPEDAAVPTPARKGVSSSGFWSRPWAPDVPAAPQTCSSARVFGHKGRVPSELEAGGGLWSQGEGVAWAAGWQSAPGDPAPRARRPAHVVLPLRFLDPVGPQAEDGWEICAAWAARPTWSCRGRRSPQRGQCPPHNPCPRLAEGSAARRGTNASAPKGAIQALETRSR